MPSPQIHHFIEQFRSYEQEQMRWTKEQKLQFLNQLEEEASLSFLALEKKLRETKGDSKELKMLREELHQTACLIDRLLQLFESFDRDFSQDVFEKEKCNIVDRCLAQGSSYIEVLLEKSRLKIFKPDISYDHHWKDEAHNLGQQLGILNGERTSARASASYLISQKLKLDLVPPTCITIHQGKRGSLQEWVKGTSLLEKKLVPISSFSFSQLISIHTLQGLREAIAREATGKGLFSLHHGLILKSPLRYQEGNMQVYKNGIPITAAKAEVFFMMRKIELGEKKIVNISEPNFSLPVLQKGLLDAQAFDFIIGQIDRHIGNLLIQDSKRVLLIDHDFTFPQKFKKLDEETKKIFALGSSLIELPPLLDQKTARSIMLFQVEELQEELLALGLTHEEIEACKSRLAVLKEHLHQLAIEKKLVHTWNFETYQTLTRDQKNEEAELRHNNYISKFIEEQKKRLSIFSLIQKQEKEWEAFMARSQAPKP